MALTHADLDRLDAAIATSELEVEFDGRRTRFRSIPELQAARAHVAGVLASQSVQSSGGSAFVPVYADIVLTRER